MVVKSLLNRSPVVVQSKPNHNQITAKSFLELYSKRVDMRWHGSLKEGERERRKSGRLALGFGVTAETGQDAFQGG